MEGLNSYIDQSVKLWKNIQEDNTHDCSREQLEFTCIVGPEGGFSLQESQMMRKLHNMCFENILKSETAAISAISIIKSALDSHAL